MRVDWDINQKLNQIKSDNAKKLKLFCSTQDQDIKCLYEHLLALQEEKAKIHRYFSGDWGNISQHISETIDEALLQDLEKQEEEIANFIKDELLRKLGINATKKQNTSWEFGSFTINGIDNIDCTNLDFFPTIKDYKIRFERCKFVGTKAKNGDDREWYFLPLDYSEKEIDFHLFFSDCEFQNFINFKGSTFSEVIVFQNCKFLGGINFQKCTFKDEVYFEDVVFKKASNFAECLFEKGSTFRGLNTFFKSYANFSNTTFKDFVDFSDVNFELGASFTLFQGDQEKGFRSYATFRKAYFKGFIEFQRSFFSQVCFSESVFESANFSESNFSQTVDFSDSYFLGETTFKDAKIGTLTSSNDQKFSAKFSRCVFEKNVDFSSVQFLQDVYFHRAIFEKDIQFYRSYFNKVANFYFATFEEVPNFSMCVFNNPKFANFVGITLPFDSFERLKNYINTKADEEISGKSKEDNLKKGRTKTYLLIQHSLNIRDSFRVVKETLIAQSNSLDSQIWHKMELYAKELEYLYRTNIKNLADEIRELESQKKEEIRQEQDRKQQEQEKKIEENFARGGRFSMIIGEIYHPKDSNPKLPQRFDSKETLKSNEAKLMKNTIEKWQLWFYRHTSDHHTDLTRIISWVIIAIGVFGLIFFWAKCIQNPSTFSHLNPYAVNLSLWGTIFLLIPYLAGWIKSFFIFAGSVGLIPILWIVCYKPSLIFGAVNLLEKNSKYSGLENIILAIYTLIMILLLFSLQKTARKNSIIPN